MGSSCPSGEINGSGESLFPKQIWFKFIALVVCRTCQGSLANKNSMFGYGIPSCPLPPASCQVTLLVDATVSVARSAADVIVLLEQVGGQTRTHMSGFRLT